MVRDTTGSTSASGPVVSPVRLVGGRYRVDEVIGTGAMGTVWRGYDTRLRRPVAIKEVHLAAAVTDAQRKVLTRRAMAEAQHAARVSHPNIVAVHDVVADRGMPCLVMRLVEGRSISDLVRKEGPVSPVRTAEIGIALVDALSAAHQAGVVHRDVKPSNVLLTDTEVLLTDFSIATDAAQNTFSAGSGALGSPGYIAPERLKGEPTGARADLFGLGATLFCAVEGRGPFDRADPLASLLATATNPHPMPKRAGPLGALLDALLAKDPSERPDLAEIRAVLVAIAKSPEAAEPGPATFGPSVSGPATSGPATSGPAAFGPAAFGPAAFGPAAFGPAAFGPATSGPATSGPAASGPATSGPAAFGPAAFGSAAGSPATSGPATAGPATFGPAAASASAANPSAAIPDVPPLSPVAEGPDADFPTSPGRPVPAHVAPKSRQRTVLLIGVALLVACLAAYLVTTAVRGTGHHTNSSAAVAAASLPAASAPPGSTPPAPSASGAKPSVTTSSSVSPTPTHASASAAPPRPSSSASTAAPSAGPPGQVTGAALTLSQTSYLGSCTNDISLTATLTVQVSEPTDVRYRLLFAPGNTQVASGAGASQDTSFTSSDSLSVHFDGSGTYAVQAQIDSPTQYAPVPATIHAICL